MNFVTPSGFRDVLTDEAVLREQAAQAVQANMAAKGYLPVETPTLEVMDVLQAGGRLPGTPFKLFDSRGDLLALRPDVTLQIARMCATRLAGQPGPFRFRYQERVFREAEGRPQAEAREMTQVGVELIGEAGPSADAEVIALLAESLEQIGVEDFRISVATVGVLRALLAGCGADEAWKSGVLSAYHASNFVKLDELTGPGAQKAGVAPVFAQAIRALANGLGVSVITTKRAYSDLEAEGFIATVQGKGSFVAAGNHELLRERRLRQVEELLAQAGEQAAELGVSRAELHDMLDLVAPEDLE